MLHPITLRIQAQVQVQGQPSAQKGPNAGLDGGSRVGGAQAGNRESSAVPNEVVPARLTLPRDLPADADEQGNDPGSVANAVANRHEEAGAAGAPPAEQGFVKAQLSKVGSFIKDNWGKMAMGVIAFGLTVATGGTAAVVPALWGVGVSMALMGVTSCLLGKGQSDQVPNEAEDPDQADVQVGDASAAAAAPPMSPVQYVEKSKYDELERKLAEFEALRQQPQPAAAQGAAVGAPVAEAVDRPV
jgi:hypothetical protein